MISPSKTPLITNFLDLKPKEFRFLAEIIRSHTGIVLSENKREMVRGRIIKRLRSLNIDSFEAYCEYLHKDPKDELEYMVNAITTNITQFFREPHHFKTLSEELDSLTAKSNNGRIRIWSAGCSTGEEPYSIAMTVLAELSPYHCKDMLVLATDIDTNVLARASAGIYPDKAATDFSLPYRRRFVLRGPEPQTVQISEEVRSIVRFRHLNLLESWPMKGPFDVIFCRNVAIYFDKPTQRTLMSRYANILKPGGLLFVGHSESLLGVTENFDLIGKTSYRRHV